MRKAELTRPCGREPGAQRSPGGLAAAGSLASGHSPTLPVDQVSGGGGTQGAGPLSELVAPRKAPRPCLRATPRGMKSLLGFLCCVL